MDTFGAVNDLVRALAVARDAGALTGYSEAMLTFELDAVDYAEAPAIESIDVDPVDGSEFRSKTLFDHDGWVTVTVVQRTIPLTPSVHAKVVPTSRA